MNNLTNLSDGKSNGFIIMYVKDGVVYPINFSEVQRNYLDSTIGSIPEMVKVVIDMPLELKKIIDAEVNAICKKVLQ